MTTADEGAGSDRDDTTAAVPVAAVPADTAQAAEEAETAEGNETAEVAEPVAELSGDLAHMQAALENIEAVPLDERVELFQQMNRDIAGYLAELDEL